MPIPSEILFINKEYLTKYTQLNEAVDTNLIRPAIYLAQDKYIQLWLGTDLMNKIKSDIQNNTLAGNYATLLNNYIVKPTAWWTMVELYPSLVYKLDNGNVVSRQSEDTTPVTKGELDSLVDKARDNATFYTQRLVDYLCDNNSLFPEYTSNTSPDISPLKKVNRQSSVMFSDGYKDYDTRIKWSIRDFYNG
jgi:hypothetical protein